MEESPTVVDTSDSKLVPDEPVKTHTDSITITTTTIAQPIEKQTQTSSSEFDELLGLTVPEDFNYDEELAYSTEIMMAYPNHKYMLQDVWRFLCTPEAVSPEFLKDQKTICKEVLHYCNCLLRLVHHPQRWKSYLGHDVSDTKDPTLSSSTRLDSIPSTRPHASLSSSPTLSKPIHSCTDENTDTESSSPHHSSSSSSSQKNSDPSSLTELLSSSSLTPASVTPTVPPKRRHRRAISIIGRDVSVITDRHLKLKALAALFHHHLALALTEVAEVERAFEQTLEQVQQSFIQEAKQQQRGSITGDDIRLHETHIDSNEVNPVNYCYFLAEEQFVGAEECFQFVLDEQKKINTNLESSSNSSNCKQQQPRDISGHTARAESEGGNVEPLLDFDFPGGLSHARITCDWSVSLCQWAHWQHSCCKFESSIPHQPSKDEERALLDIYDLYSRASSMCEAVAKARFGFIPDSVLNRMTLDALTDLFCDPTTASVQATRRRELLKTWADAVDGLISLRLTYSLMDAGKGYDASCRDGLSCIAALSLNSDPQIHGPALELFEHLRHEAVCEEVKDQARTSISMAHSIIEAERTATVQWIQHQLQILVASDVHIDQSFFTADLIATNVKVFRNAVFFRYGYLLPSHLHQNVNTASPRDQIRDRRNYAPHSIQALKEHIRKMSSRRRTSTIAAVIAHKLFKAIEVIDDSTFSSLTLEENIHQITQDWCVIGHGAFGEVFSAKYFGNIDKILERNGSRGSRSARSTTTSRARAGSSSSSVVSGGINPELKSGYVVAVKRISMDQHIRELKKEIRTLEACCHQNIVAHVATYQWDQHLWVVMEYCDGGTLEALRRGNDMDEPTIAYICRELLCGLEYLHDVQHKVHRDLKPENVFLHLDGQVKIGDLGFCVDTGYETRHTRNSIAGTARYLAPEMIKKDGYCSKLDIWSFGCMVYFMACGKDLYHNESSLSAMFQIATKGAPSLPHNARWSPEFLHFLDASLQPDPSLRWSAAQLLRHPFLTECPMAEMNDLRVIFHNVFVGRALQMAGLA